MGLHCTFGTAPFLSLSIYRKYKTKNTVESLQNIDKNATCYDWDSGHFVLVPYNTDEKSNKKYIDDISKKLE